MIANLFWQLKCHGVAESSEIPCKFAASREFSNRDEFAHDSLLQRGVRCEPDPSIRAPIVVTHLTLANYYERGHLHRIAGRSLSDHIAAMRRHWNAVAHLL